MRKWAQGAIMLVCLAGSAAAKDADLRLLETGVDADAWEAVGRLDLGGRGFCTGALIAPDVVLTAAHCLFDKRSGVQIDPSDIEFLAGWRNGRAAAYRRVKHATVHAAYTFSAAVAPQRVRHDLALLRLVRAIHNTTIAPFQTAAPPAKGATVGLVSYARDRAEAPSLQDVCRVLARQQGVLVTTCSVGFGSSGAPIFSIKDGVATIVSVVSAKAEVEGRVVSLGTDLSEGLASLLADLDQQNRTFISSGAPVPQSTVDESRSTLGAKFIRPGQ